MSAWPPAPLITYPHLYDACAKRGLKVKLHLATDPEGMNAREETYLPAARIDDFMEGHEAEHIEPPSGRHVKRTITFFVEVHDGEHVACSGDLGERLDGSLAVCALRRMAGVLVAGGRAQPRDFPHLRPTS